MSQDLSSSAGSAGSDERAIADHATVRLNRGRSNACSCTLLALTGVRAVRRSQGLIIASKVAFGDLVLDAAEGRTAGALRFLRDDAAFRCAQLTDVVLLPTSDSERTCVVYNLLSLEHARRLRLRTWRAAGFQAPTAAGLFANARLLEQAMYAELNVAHAFLGGHVEAHVDRVSGMLLFEPIPRET